MNASALEARSLYRFFRAGDEETLALQGVSLTVARGEFVAVTGPSGSGKSTLLSCMAGMDDPDGGDVTIDGSRVSHRPGARRARIRARHIGMLFQSANLIEHLTVIRESRPRAVLCPSTRPAHGGPAENLGHSRTCGRLSERALRRRTRQSRPRGRARERPDGASRGRTDGRVGQRHGGTDPRLAQRPQPTAERR